MKILILFDKIEIIQKQFAESGTTALACKQLNRDYVMIDILEEYKQMAEKRLSEAVQLELLSISQKVMFLSP
ncbi:MAG: DNA methyltransferase [Candidatus Poribacteria bacterium]